MFSLKTFQFSMAHIAKTVFPFCYRCRLLHWRNKYTHLHNKWPQHARTETQQLWLLMIQCNAVVFQTVKVLAFCTINYIQAFVAVQKIGNQSFKVTVLYSNEWYNNTPLFRSTQKCNTVLNMFCTTTAHHNWDTRADFENFLIPLIISWLLSTWNNDTVDR